MPDEPKNTGSAHLWDEFLAKTGLNRSEARDAIGITNPTVRSYEAGAPIKLTVRLAMMAVWARLPPFGSEELTMDGEEEER